MYLRPGSIVELWKMHANPDERKKYKDCEVFLLKAESYETTQNEPYFFIDHSIGQLVYISQNLQDCLPCLGEDIYGTSYEYSSKRIELAYFDFVTQSSFKWAFEYLCQLPVEKRLKMRISKDFLYRNLKGELVWRLMRTTVVDLGYEGGILLSMCTIHDINHIRKGDHSNLIIAGNGLKPEMYQFDKHTARVGRLNDITPREWEILQELKKSLDSKSVAAQLGTATSTVSGQRQKLMDTFGCQNMTGLLQYLIDVGVLV